MRPWFVLLLVGGVAVVGPVAAYLYHRSAHEREVRNVVPLRAALDSARASFTTAPTRADSARVAAILRAREAGLSQRDYHLALGQARLDHWWDLPGLWSLTVAVGVVLVVVGLARRRSPRSHENL